MNNEQNFNFDNVKPNNKSFKTKNINFQDKNDLINNEKKRQKINFAKRSNLFISLLTVSFVIFISFNLIITTTNVKTDYNSINEEVLNKRGKILDKNSEIVATSLETKDLYIDLKSPMELWVPAITGFQINL